MTVSGEVDVAWEPCWQVEPLPVTLGLWACPALEIIAIYLLFWLQILLKTISSQTSSAVNIYKVPPLVKDQTSYFQICSSPTLLLREFGRRVKPGETKRITHCSTLNGKSSQSDLVQSFLPSQIRFCKNKILNQQMSAQAACLSNLALRCVLMSVTSFMHLSRIRAIPRNWWSFSLTFFVQEESWRKLRQQSFILHVEIIQLRFCRTWKMEEMVSRAWQLKTSVRYISTSSGIWASRLPLTSKILLLPFLPWEADWWYRLTTCLITKCVDGDTNESVLHECLLICCFMSTFCLNKGYVKQSDFPKKTQHRGAVLWPCVRYLVFSTTSLLLMLGTNIAVLLWHIILFPCISLGLTWPLRFVRQWSLLWVSVSPITSKNSVEYIIFTNLRT